ncbi:hypothetical protein PROSTU_02866 [Providencia stuartii ATCC 25827]|uniref:Uncharacterized protein n=1 Tax=Providencia stuartii ATCC 25827 TaxID=471874 RepID=A0AA86YMH3_PROST|nr:hypothetical protein PROSTU_02866 [Providencia stuartii ATCC 25827]
MEPQPLFEVAAFLHLSHTYNLSLCQSINSFIFMVSKMDKKPVFKLK